MSNSSSKPEEYPTLMIEDGHRGKGVQLTTRRTSGLADAVKNLSLPATSLSDSLMQQMPF